MTRYLEDIGTKNSSRETWMLLSAKYVDGLDKPSRATVILKAPPLKSLPEVLNPMRKDSIATEADTEKNLQNSLLGITSFFPYS